MDDLDLVVVGQTVIELVCKGPIEEATLFRRSPGGPGAMTALAAARLGGRVGLITRLADDPFAPLLLGVWRRAGIDLSRVRRARGTNPIAIVQEDPDGTREYGLYRPGSPGTDLEPEDLDASYVRRSAVVFAAGLSQALAPSSHAAIRAAFAAARRGGTVTALEADLHLERWNLDEARAAFTEIVPSTDLLLFSTTPETADLLEAAEPATAAAVAVLDRGVRAAIVRDRDYGLFVMERGMSDPIAFRSPAARRTADMGPHRDRFAAAFLLAHARGLPPVDAARHALQAVARRRRIR